jgi:hypothetical protein
MTFPEPPHRLGKGHVVVHHEELEDIAPMPAAEALEDLLARIDKKGGSLLLVEGTKSFVFRPRLFQRHVAPDDVDNIAGMAHLLDDFRRDHAGHASP